MTGRWPPFTVRVVRARLACLRRFRPDPLRLDRTLAALLTVGAELEVWLGSGAAHERLVAAVIAPAVTATVAIRRLYRSEEHTSELQSRLHLVCRLLLEKKKKVQQIVKRDL